MTPPITCRDSTACILLLAMPVQRKTEIDPDMRVYEVKRLKGPMRIDANWDKAQWQDVESVDIGNLMGDTPVFTPTTEVKMMYDENNLYLIFKVKDRFIRIVTDKINGPVWQDAAVEFFFSPDTDAPADYFNLEVTGGGTPLLGYKSKTGERARAEEIDIREIEITHTLPKLVDPEIIEPTDWTLEYRIPIGMLRKYAKISQPTKGVSWRANFFKISENLSNTHYLTWSVVNSDKPNFHLPQFFGLLEFQ